MTQSQPLRSASLCHKYWSSAPRTWSMTQPQSRSDHVPGNTTTPNFTRTASRDGVGGSARNRRFRGVRIQRRRTSSALVTVRLDLKAIVLDHVVGEQLLAHRFDALPGLVLAARLEADLDVLADAHVTDFAKTERGKTLLDRDPLWVVDDWLRRHYHSGDHGRRPRREIRGTGGPDARRGRASERAHPLMREREAEAATNHRGPQAKGLGPLGTEDPSRGSGRDREITWSRLPGRGARTPGRCARDRPTGRTPRPSSSRCA